MVHLTVIVPVFGDDRYLGPCLASIRESDYSDYEIIVADDGSPDPRVIAEACARHGARLVRLERRQGPGPARNAAAREAAGDVLLFLDADETVHPDTLRRMVDWLDSDPALDAIVGSYDLDPGSNGLVANFRNLLHAHVHHRSAGFLSTFWAGCGALRRERFEQLGGFMPHPVEDVELGMRLHRAGGLIRLDPKIQVKHHKEWTLRSMIHTDALVRAAPWTELILTHGLPRKLNFRWRDRLTAAVAAMLPALVWLGIGYGGLWVLASGAAMAAVLALQWDLFSFLRRTRGAAFAGACVPLYVLHQWSAAAGFAAGLARSERKRDRQIPAVAALLALAVFGIVQWGGGAYWAEYDGYPDEASHFMTGLMLRDYATLWPLPRPLPWAEQYYAHYPRTGLGAWPPLFHLIEGAWWLFVSPSRQTAILLVGMMAFVSALLFYRLARSVAPFGWALAGTALMVATPVFQQSSAQVMAEQLSLLIGILYLGCLIRFMRSPSPRPWPLILLCGLALLVKGTGLSLAAAPLLAMALAGRRISIAIALRAMAAIGVIVGAVGAWYLSQYHSLDVVLRWAGVGVGSPWSWAAISGLAGPGMIAVAAAGLVWSWKDRNPEMCSCAAVVLAFAGTSWVVRAIQEPRHWIMALPALILMSVITVRQLAEIRVKLLRLGALLAASALVLGTFPWKYYRQEPQGTDRLLQQIAGPARYYVSALNVQREGGWIAAVSARESRPSSVVVRSSRTLNQKRAGTRKPMTVTSPREAADWMDRYAISVVILDEFRGSPNDADRTVSHALVRSAVQADAAWKGCAQFGPLTAYCRMTAPRLPRQKLQLEPIRGYLIEEK